MQADRRQVDSCSVSGKAPLNFITRYKIAAKKFDLQVIDRNVVLSLARDTRYGNGRAEYLDAEGTASLPELWNQI